MVRTPKLSSADTQGLVRSGFASMVMQGAGGISTSPVSTSPVSTSPVSTSPVWSKVAEASTDNRILVIVELSGGNDGLNTVIPHADDAYFRARPKLGIRRPDLLALDDHFGFQKTMSGFERLYKDGQMAIVHGVGYDQPSFSHFSSMAFWQTGAPNSGEAYGWLGRLADAFDPLGQGCPA